MVNVKHSSESSSWYSPKDILEASRAVLGTINLDPASCSEANETVKAIEYYDEQENGLEQLWYGNVFCNPPGGKLKGQSMAKLFWQKLLSSPQVNEAIFVAFSIELLQTSQLGGFPGVTQYAMCIPKRRLHFTDINGAVLKSNTHASAIIYVGSDIHKFAVNFNHFGNILLPFGDV